MNLIINKKLCPAGLANNPNKPLKSVSFITIHTTGNRKPTASAENHADYQFGGSGGIEKSWHYTVDADTVWQSFEDTQMCWHAGDGSGAGNSTSIGIEICVNNQARFGEACDLAARLTAELLIRHGLWLDNVVQHNHWSGKDCPAELRSGEWGINWNGFMELVQKYVWALKEAPSDAVPAWQKAALEKLIRVGIVQTPEYWESRFDSQITVGEVFGLLANMFQEG